MTPRFNKWALSILIAAGIPFYWLFLDSSGKQPPKDITLPELQKKAASLPGAYPTVIRYERVGHNYVSRNLLAAGTGLRPTPYAIKAYEVLYPDGRSVMIDAGTSAEAAKNSGIDNFNRAAQARINAASSRAELHLTLVDHPLHDGGSKKRRSFHASPPPSPSDRTVAMETVAPGIVTIEMPGLMHGSRMVFVHLASGRQVLFTGDAAPIAESWQQVRAPARIAAWFQAQDRRQILSWLETINQLRRANPALTVVSGHDYEPARFIGQGMKPPRTSGAPVVSGSDSPLAIRAGMR